MNTSQSAKQVASVTAGQVREQIFAYVDSCATGATCDEIERRYLLDIQPARLG